MHSRPASTAEYVCALLLFLHLLWVPLPFASTPDAFQFELIVPALIICALAALTLALQRGVLRMTSALIAWSFGAVACILIVAFQLVPLPSPLLALLSPESNRIWSGASRVVSLVMNRPASSWHPISIDPTTTTLHLCRLLAYFATFMTAALLIRRHATRVMFAVVLSSSAIFQMLYAVREATMGRYAIWGWKNNLIYDRATGTFVNPNHFAHYAAIILPMGFFFAAVAWHDAAPSGVLFRRRLVKLFERRLLLFALGFVIVIACFGSILIARSRGALLAMLVGFAASSAAASRRRGVRTLLTTAAIFLLIVILGVTMGVERTSIGRLIPTSGDLLGRRAGVAIAFQIWRHFPLFGSGLGTYIDFAPAYQPPQFDSLFNHAHNDYIEIAATTGLVGLTAFVLSLAIGLTRFVRTSFEKREIVSYRHRAFQAAAFTSIATALVHAFFDFNFFIPANALTLAAIAGAAVAIRFESGAPRDSASTDSLAGSPLDDVPQESSQAPSAS